MNRVTGYVSAVQYQRRVELFTASGTFTPPAGVTYAIAYIRGGGGSVGTASNEAGGNSSVAFASGTVTATGGAAAPTMFAFGNYRVTAGTANSGQGAKGNQFRTADVGDSSVTFGGDGAYVVSGAAVTAGTGITVTVGAGGTAGTNGAAGGSGVVWIEYDQPIGAGL